MSYGGRSKKLNCAWGWLMGLWVMFFAVAERGLLGASVSLPSEDNSAVRRILSENCFTCHGPDAKTRKSGKKLLRLDLSESARTDTGDGHPAIIPGQPENSELIRRITTTDVDDKMPPPDSDKKLTPQEIELLKKWIKQGAEYATHWSYVPPRRSPLPAIQDKRWPKNSIDYFLLARIEQEKLKHATEAEPAALIRRVTLDLTGLPPTLAEVKLFLADRKPGAYERLVDRVLKNEAFGEHWARLWLDQARYADSSGYADDPSRTIWAYRDYVVRSLNSNQPFDQFTLEQIAGDLIQNPTDEQLVATAFHRNTMTNNEGGTSDEEYRNVAVVDRVNTTMAVWMGTTMACAQCHNHKYDPITQEDYFRLFAILNNTSDADKGDESPIHPLFTQEQKNQRNHWRTNISRLEAVLKTPTPELDKGQEQWEQSFKTEPRWDSFSSVQIQSKSGAKTQILDGGIVEVERGGKTDTYTLTVPLATNEVVSALRIDVLPNPKSPDRGLGHADGNFVVSRVLSDIVPIYPTRLTGRFLKIDLVGKDRILSLAEVQVFDGATNIALRGEAKQSTTASDGSAKLAIDGNTDGDYAKARSTTHTAQSADPWWELDLKSTVSLDRIVLWNRTDGSPERLNGFRLSLLNEKRETIWQHQGQSAPSLSIELLPDGRRSVGFAFASADFSQKDYEAEKVINNADLKSQGWAIAPQIHEPHSLTLVPQNPITIGSGSNLVVTIEHLSKTDYATIARLRLSKSIDPRAAAEARVPRPILAMLRGKTEPRTADQRQDVLNYYLSIAQELQPVRDELAVVTKNLAESKPYTTVPILRELADDKRRKTTIQHRGNFLDLGAEVTNGLPVSLLAYSRTENPDRLALAQWLVDKNNPLTARVVVNRLWESIFGTGLVRTSEEFGLQGELPSHPELLDWLATELMAQQWDTKQLLRLMVTSAAYRQSSRVVPDVLAQDFDNRLLARGPRFRLSAEMIRDQALSVSGLLSPKMYGPPVRPPQPKSGLSAAFGSATDWDPSTGEDRFRRALYTTWRRSNPYPSMATFDAPNREVCLVRRDRSNTPLQALVTLNDPVYVEASQALARKMVSSGRTPSEKARHGFQLCLSRAPTRNELKGLVGLYNQTFKRFQNDPTKAKELAYQPLEKPSSESKTAELAAWTVVGNVLLNLDEMLMKR